MTDELICNFYRMTKGADDASRFFGAAKASDIDIAVTGCRSLGSNKGKAGARKPDTGKPRPKIINRARRQRLTRSLPDINLIGG
jgi:hypothetical protein